MKKLATMCLFVIIAFCIESFAEHFGGTGLIVAQLFDSETSTKAGETVVLGVLTKSNEIKPGDVIVEIDGKATKGVDFVAIVNSLRGKVGSTVKLKVKRTGIDELLIFHIIREEFTAPTKN